MSSVPPRTDLRGLVEVVILASTAAALYGLATELPPTPSFLVNLALVSVGPGYALLGPRGLELFGPASLIATSLSVSALLSLIPLYTGAWNATFVISALAVLSLAGVALRRLPGLWRRAAGGGTINLPR